MRELLLLSVFVVVALAIDAYGFDGQYRKATLREVNYETQEFASKIKYLLTAPLG
jgi:hypothetical protein